MYHLPKLNYALTELSPFLNEEQMKFHYEKHHNTYIENMNKTLATDAAKAEWSLEKLVHETTGPLFNNAAQTYNHTFFWFGLSPKAKGGAPSEALMAAIKKDFGSFDDFYKQFVDVGLKTFGSGWVWLCATPENQLKLVSTSNAEVPFKGTDLRPLLTADVWEHAYYVDYRNRRQAFLETMKDYINWNFVNENFNSKTVLSLHKAVH
jgi:superoxide dismutase, Fe-Mn family